MPKKEKEDHRALRPTPKIMDIVSSHEKWFSYLTDEMLPDGTDAGGREELLVLYRWTHEEAQREEQAAGNPLKNGILLGKLHSPILLWEAVQNLRFLYLQHSQGDKCAVLDALNICLLHRFAIPKWCRKGFLEAHSAVANYEVASWDDAFGKPHPKGTHIGTEAKKQKYQFRVYHEVKARHKKGEPMDINLFDTIGRELGVGGGETVRTMYYELEHVFLGKT